MVVGLDLPGAVVVEDQRVVISIARLVVGAVRESRSPGFVRGGGRGRAIDGDGAPLELHEVDAAYTRVQQALVDPHQLLVVVGRCRVRHD
jgi:hypothetical protein